MHFSVSFLHIPEVSHIVWRKAECDRGNGDIFKADTMKLVVTEFKKKIPIQNYFNTKNKTKPRNKEINYCILCNQQQSPLYTYLLRSLGNYYNMFSFGKPLTLMYSYLFKNMLLNKYKHHGPKVSQAHHEICCSLCPKSLIWNSKRK